MQQKEQRGFKLLVSTSVTLNEAGELLLIMWAHLQRLDQNMVCKISDEVETDQEFESCLYLLLHGVRFGFIKRL